MSEQRFDLIGVGLYSIPEAAKLTGIPAATIGRWVKGYARARHGKLIEHPAVAPSSLPKIDDAVALSFRDLTEVRFIGKLRALRVSWPEIRRTVDLAQELLKTRYPFGSLKFKTDGKQVFAEIEKSGALLRSRQFVFATVFEPSLFAELEYEGGVVARWRPEAGRNVVVLDPERSFGKPILDEFDIQTQVIARAVAAEEGSERRVADWYDITVPAVQAAVHFERQLLAA
jgi:uncharacterized protein (DUF433 family)